MLACPSVLCRAGQRSECPGQLRDRSGSSVHDSLACGVTCASANAGPGAQNRCPASAQTELFGSLWSVSGRIKWFNRIHFAWWHFKYRNGAPFSGDKKPFSYGCERPVISRPPWLQGPAGPWPALSPSLCCSRRRETEARRVWGSITESSLEGLCFHYPWDLGCDKVSGTSCF